MHEPPEERPVLDREGPVQAQRVSERSDLLRRAVLLKHHLRRVARHQVNHEEYEDRDAEQDRNQLQEPAGDVPCHVPCYFRM
jgi:hypothetical protein